MAYEQIGSLAEPRDLWEPQSWRPEALPSPAALVKAVQETPETLEELEDYYAPASYSRRLS